MLEVLFKGGLVRAFHRRSLQMIVPKLITPRIQGMDAPGRHETRTQATRSKS